MAVRCRTASPAPALSVSARSSRDGAHCVVHGDGGVCRHGPGGAEDRRFRRRSLDLHRGSSADSLLIEAVVVLALLGLGVWAAGVVEEQLGKDPEIVVIDEVLGMLVTLAFLDVNPVGAVIGFFIFRVLDVGEAISCGTARASARWAGIMLDDAMAGIYGNLRDARLIALAPGLPA